MKAINQRGCCLFVFHPKRTSIEYAMWAVYRDFFFHVTLLPSSIKYEPSQSHFTDKETLRPQN